MNDENVEIEVSLTFSKAICLYPDNFFSNITSISTHHTQIKTKSLSCTMFGLFFNSTSKKKFSSEFSFVC